MLVVLLVLSLGLLAGLVTSEAAHYPAPHSLSSHCPAPQRCVPPVLCPAPYLASLYDPAAQCYLAHGTPGVCCKGQTKSCKCYFALYLCIYIHTSWRFMRVELCFLRRRKVFDYSLIQTRREVYCREPPCPRVLTLHWTSTRTP